MEKLFTEFYVPYVYGLTTASLIINLLLSIVIYVSPDKPKQYIKYTISFVAANFLFSILAAISMPYWYQFPQVIALFSVSPFSSSIDALFIKLWYIINLGVLKLVFTSFVHRYAVFCNSSLKPYFESKLGLAMIIVIPVSSALAVDVFYRTLLSDGPVLRLRLNTEIGLNIGIDFELIQFIVIDFNDVKTSICACTVVILLSLAMVAIYIGIIYCAWAINRTIKLAVFSVSLRKKHVKALRMLLLQSINPLVFLYGPISLTFFACVLTENFHVPEKISNLMIHFFPITNAIIILSLTDEYRNTLLQRGNKVTGQSSTMY